MTMNTRQHNVCDFLICCNMTTVASMLLTAFIGIPADLL